MTPGAADDGVTDGTRFESSFGTKSIASVAPGKNAVHAFTTRQQTVPAASVAVNATATIDGEPETVSLSAPYDARSCG